MISNIKIDNVDDSHKMILQLLVNIKPYFKAVVWSVTHVPTIEKPLISC